MKSLIPVRDRAFLCTRVHKEMSSESCMRPVRRGVEDEPSRLNCAAPYTRRDSSHLEVCR